MMENLVSKTFRQFSKKNNAILIVIVSLIITFGCILSYSIYEGINFYIDRISGNISVSILFKKDAKDSEITDYLINLKKNPYVNEINFVSLLQAKKDFSRNYAFNSDELLSGENFPAVAKIYIKKEYQTPTKFYSSIGLLKGNIIIEDILYNKEFIQTYFNFIEQERLLTKMISGFMLIIFIFLFYLSSKKIFDENKEDYRLYLTLGGGKLTGLMPTLLFIVICSIIGIIICSVISLFLWNFYLHNFFKWFNINIINLILEASVLSLIFEIVFSLFVTAISSKNK
jgi:cell division transport system permease protein